MIFPPRTACIPGRCPTPKTAEIFGKCNWENGHGHNYDVEVTLTGEPDPRTGLLFDGETLDALVEERGAETL